MKRTITILLAMLLCLNLAVTAFGADTCIVAKLRSNFYIDNYKVAVQHTNTMKTLIITI